MYEFIFALYVCISSVILYFVILCFRNFELRNLEFRKNECDRSATNILRMLHIHLNLADIISSDFPNNDYCKYINEIPRKQSLFYLNNSFEEYFDTLLYLFNRGLN